MYSYVHQDLQKVTSAYTIVQIQNCAQFVVDLASYYLQKGFSNTAANFSLVT